MSTKWLDVLTLYLFSRAQEEKAFFSLRFYSHLYLLSFTAQTENPICFHKLLVHHLSLRLTALSGANEGCAIKRNTSRAEYKTKKCSGRRRASAHPTRRALIAAAFPHLALDQSRLCEKWTHHSPCIVEPPHELPRARFLPLHPAPLRRKCDQRSGCRVKILTTNKTINHKLFKFNELNHYFTF